MSAAPSGGSEHRDILDDRTSAGPIEHGTPRIDRGISGLPVLTRYMYLWDMLHVPSYMHVYHVCYALLCKHYSVATLVRHPTSAHGEGVARAELSRADTVCNGRPRLARKSASDSVGEHTNRQRTHKPRPPQSKGISVQPMQRSYSKHGQRDTKASEGEPVRTETSRSYTCKRQQRTWQLCHHGAG